MENRKQKTPLSFEPWRRLTTNFLVLIPAESLASPQFSHEKEKHGQVMIIQIRKESSPGSNNLFPRSIDYVDLESESQGVLCPHGQSDADC